MATLAAAVEPAAIRFTHAVDYETARDCLKQAHHDVLILDLHIPGAGQMPSPAFAIALLQDLVKGILNAPTHVIGLTQHEESALLHRESFARYLFHLEIFSHNDTGWARRIADKLRYLFDAQRAMSRYALSRSGTDILVVVARGGSEFVPISSRIDWVAEPQDGHVMFPGSRVLHGMVKTPSGEQRSLVFACFEEMGIAAAAVHSSNLLHVFRPKLVAMLGMCCGFRTAGRNANLNDIIVADEVACWDEGKYVEGTEDISRFISRAKTITVREPLAKYLSSFMERRGDALAKKLSKMPENTRLVRLSQLAGYSSPNIELKAGRIVSGLSVVSDREKVRSILERSPSAVALDMETYGVFKAAKSMPLFRPYFVAIKGVADFGFDKVDKRFDPAQKTASVLSYATFWEFMDFLEGETTFWE